MRFWQSEIEQLWIKGETNLINKIKLDNCIPYKHSEISDCKKINFIYGANGSGKSTISSYLAGTTDTRFGESVSVISCPLYFHNRIWDNFDVGVENVQ